jgi:GTP-binding nuclear protein Ran
MQTFKLLLVGDSGCGKTTLVKRHITGEFERDHKPTLGVEVRPINFKTNHGSFKFNVWDIAGDPKFEGLTDGYVIGAHCAIIMVDLTKNIADIDRFLSIIPPGIPKILVGNKCDFLERKLPIEICGKLAKKVNNTFINNCNHNYFCHYFEISAKSNYNFEKPFLYLLQELTGYQDLKFTVC